MRLRVVIAAAASLGLAASALAQGSDLATFTAFGGTDVQIGRDVRVLGGDLGSNGTLSLSAGVIVAGGVAANVVRGARGVVVEGEAAYNVLSSNGGSFLGPQTTPIAIPILVLPAPPTIPTTPLVNQDLAPGTVTTLAPGGDHPTPGPPPVTPPPLAAPPRART